LLDMEMADRLADMGGNVGGSNIAAAKAATLHQEWVTNLGGQYLIGSPAVARGSKKWMDVSHFSKLARVQADRYRTG
jgi:hypothetical protein